jgi:tetrahydromethanopterin S-methyltransferase subunit F
MRRSELLSRDDRVFLSYERAKAIGLAQGAYEAFMFMGTS